MGLRAIAALEANDVVNDLVTENEGPFISFTDAHAATP